MARGSRGRFSSRPYGVPLTPRVLTGFKRLFMRHPRVDRRRFVLHYQIVKACTAALVEDSLDRRRFVFHDQFCGLLHDLPDLAGSQASEYWGFYANHSVACGFYGVDYRLRNTYRT